MNSFQYVMIALSLIILATVVNILVAQDSENYTRCVCTSEDGGRQGVCQNKEEVNIAYDQGLATEYTNRAPKGWNKKNVGDLDFPHAIGPNVNRDTPHNYGSWDFTDFGSP
jgi:hypothetical protein